MQEKIKKARELAIVQHAEQLYNIHHYSYHLDQVYDLICEANLDEDFKIGAYLHDTLEDTPLTYEEISTDYGENVAQMVFTVSGFGANRKEKHLDMKNKLLDNLQYVNLKMADRIVNMRNCVLSGNTKLLNTYMKEMDSFKDIFSYGCDYYKDIFAKEFNYSLKEKTKPGF
jgi:(p)ppGpp synthase/HD superfamily hydrolase